MAKTAKSILVCLALLVITGADVARADWPEYGVAVSVGPEYRYKVQVVPDGSGGTIIVWRDQRNEAAEDLYAQRLSSDGTPMWAAGGIAICDVPAEQWDHRVMAHPDGGAIVVWMDRRVAYMEEDIYAQRVDNDGNLLWTPGGVAVCTDTSYQVAPAIAHDGGGGAIIVWSDNRTADTDVYAQRLDADGNALWAADGVPVCVYSGSQSAPRLIVDDTGRTIVVWDDGRTSYNNYNPHAQRLDTDGSRMWATNGVALCTASRNQRSIWLVTDGADGVIAVWRDQRDYTVDLRRYDVYAQRVDVNGNVVWPADGVAVAAEPYDQYVEDICPDGGGGVYVVYEDWWDYGADINLYVRRVNPDGTMPWGVYDAPVCTASGNQRQVRLTGDGVGGAIATWNDQRTGGGDIRAQRFDSSGSMLWTTEGIAICGASGWQTVPAITTDGMGGAIVAWEDGRDGGTPDVYAGRVYSTGDLPVPTLLQASWAGIDGRDVVVRWVLSDVAPEAEWRVLRADAGGSFALVDGAAIAGAGMSYEFRDTGCEPGRSYRYRVDVSDEDGTRTLFMTQEVTLPRAAMTLHQNVPNPFNPHTNIRYYLPARTGVTLSVFDPSGGLVVRLVDGVEDEGDHEVFWKGLDGRGRAVSSGMYFYRLRAGKEEITHKMLLLR
jgi:hypothetical protein